MQDIYKPSLKLKDNLMSYDFFVQSHYNRKKESTHWDYMVLT